MARSPIWTTILLNGLYDCDLVEFSQIFAFYLKKKLKQKGFQSQLIGFIFIGLIEIFKD